MQKKLIKYIMPVVIIIIGVLWYLLSGGLQGADMSNGPFIEVRQDDKSQSETHETTEQMPTSAKVIAVHICGAVVNPGVYFFEEGVRVLQVIEAAGGICGNGMQDYLNLAQRVNDGDRIYVPTEEEVMSGQITDAWSGTQESQVYVNINTATREELMRLPGIGESKADSIIAYRNEHGSFEKPEDIMKIGGIKEAIYNRIKDYIKV